jgi:hypothetical protein
MAALERDLANINIDLQEELRLLQSWTRGVLERHGEDNCVDLKARVAEVEEALSEIETAELSR